MTAFESRVATLTRFLYPALWRPLAMAAAAAATWLAVVPRWNGTTIVVFGREVPGYPSGVGEQATAGYMLHELLSWLLLWNAVWFVAHCATPLVRSFALGEFLWLKQCPLGRFDVTLSRLAGLGAYIGMTLVQTGVIIAVAAARFDVNTRAALRVPLAMVAYQVAVFAVVLLVADRVARRRHAALVTCLAALLPFASYLFYADTLVRWGARVARYHPVVFPFVGDLDAGNSWSLLAIGLVLLSGAVLATTGASNLRREKP